MILLKSIVIPFANGVYSHGLHSFSHLSKEAIIYDEGIGFTIF